MHNFKSVYAVMVLFCLQTTSNTPSVFLTTADIEVEPFKIQSISTSRSFSLTETTHLDMIEYLVRCSTSHLLTRSYNLCFLSGQLFNIIKYLRKSLPQALALTFPIGKAVNSTLIPLPGYL